MNAQDIHELAVAFAQTKLANDQRKAMPGHSAFASDEEEIYQFVKSYRFALDHIQSAWDDLD